MCIWYSAAPVFQFKHEINLISKLWGNWEFEWILVHLEWLLLLLLLYGCWLIIWSQGRSLGWSILRGDSGKIFVNPKERLEVNDVCLVLFVDSWQPKA